MKKIITSALFFLAASGCLLPRANAQVILPYTFSPNTSVQSSQANANFTAVANEINSHENASNPHQTTLAQILSLSNSCGATPINFNGTQGLDFLAENLTSDPTPGTAGRFFLNTTTHLLKFDDGSVIQTIGGSGSNNLTSVLNSGNSAGSFNIDLNENQLLHAKAENLASDPSSGNQGRLYWNTASKALKVDTGSAWSAIGGSQGLASVLGVSNSAGSTNINMNGNQLLSALMDKESSDPGGPAEAQFYYNTASHIPKFYNGTSWLQIGNTNSLASTLALGNSVGGTPIDFGGQQAQHMVLWNNSGSPGTGTPGYVWFDTGASAIGYETSGVNHYVCSLDDSQTLTNKTISGASNTLTNIQDGSLSSNVGLLNATKTVSGSWTFSGAPKAGAIKNTTGDSIAIPTGTGADTFVYLNAAQTLSGKTLNAPIYSGNPNFNEFQAQNFRAENVSSVPAAGNPGRLIWNVGGQNLDVDNGTNWNVIGGNPIQTWSNILANGNSAGIYNPDFNFNQALHMELENLGSAPLGGNSGRLFFNTGNLFPQYDNGTSVLTLADTSSAQTLTTKTIVPANNTISLASAHLLVGSAGGAAADVPLTGAVSITNAGVATVLTNANLTGPITSVGNATSVASQTGTGSTFVMNTNPTLVTPALGTPSSGVATNLTGTAAGLTAGNVTTNASLTGPITSVGNATSVAAQTGTGSTFMMQASPTVTGTLALPTGSAGTPSETGGTSNTGLFFPTSSTMGWSSGGTEVWRTGANGITIGNTTAQTSALYLKQSNTLETGFQMANSTNGTIWSQDVTDPTAGSWSLIQNGSNASMMILANTNYMAMMPGAGGGTPVYPFELRYPNSANSNFTLLSQIVPNSGALILPLVMCRNAIPTAGTMCGYATSGSSGNALSFAGSIATTQTSGSEQSEYIIGTQNNGTLTEGLRVKNNQLLKLAAYGAGALQTDSSGNVSTVAPGTSGNILTSNGSSWTSGAPGLTNPMTTAGDMIYGGAAGVATRVAAATAGQVPVSAGASVVFAGLPGNATVLKAPSPTSLTTTGTQTGWLFTISTSTTCAIGDTYTNNSTTYTVQGALSAQSGQVLFMSGVGSPNTGAALVRTSGAGTSSITFSANIATATYTAPTGPAPLYLRVRGAGGGGGGAGGNGGGAGGNGASTFFGPNLLVANFGGGAATSISVGGAGGAYTIGTGASGFGLSGGYGSAGQVGLNTFAVNAGMGGTNPFGGAGMPGSPSGSGNAPSPAVPNTGAGGAGGEYSSGTNEGNGGGAGGWFDVIVSPVLASYPYIIGAGGAGGSAGAGATAGGTGATGVLVIEADYQ